jgi:hypothetical protein
VRGTFAARLGTKQPDNNQQKATTMSRSRPLAFAALALAAPSAYAHHSPAAYDMAAQITIEGTVADFEWANPHVYVSLQETTTAGEKRVWQVELFSPSSLKRYGWTETTLAAGDRIKVVASPGRNRERHVAFLQTLERSGTLLLDARRVITNTVPPAQSPGAPTFSAKSLAGTWVTLPGPALGQLLGGAASLPMTPKGAAALATFSDDTDNPGRNCGAYTAPVYMILPIFRSIEIGADAIVIRGEEGGEERTIHMNRASHDGASVSVQGDSIGRWEGDVLVVDTTHFAEHRLGIAGGVPSSTAKHLVERFQLTPGGAGLTYTVTIEDPEYLTTAVQAMSPWTYRPDVPFQPLACNLENARRFLSE